MWIVWPFRKKNFGSALDVYSAFRDFVEAKMGTYVIHDENKLPYSKQYIFDSMCVLLYIERKSQRLEAIKLCAFELAFFQKDVGDLPLYPLGIDMDTVEIEDMNAVHLARFAAANPLQKERYDRFKLLRDAEWDRMKSVMAKIQKNVRP